jgi:hypothetical protein
MSELLAVSERIAAVVLLHRRALSMGDIRALPFVETDDDVLEIIDALSSSFPLKVSHAAGDPFCEDVLELC